MSVSDVSQNSSNRRRKHQLKENLIPLQENDSPDTLSKNAQEFSLFEAIFDQNQNSKL